ncbi:DUF599 domain-containing protein [Jannaschia sp. LMIT008]|uniref:DUF599 domain-containing protein n=1 Tax=Jannaschia maritima TaxID=3032585 RepID=UPI0028113182|nr:DUF599 domain-containing protein [Jannaschia sp. LMIT008]
MLPDLLSNFTPLDALAIVFLTFSWFGAGWIIEHPPMSRPSVSHLMIRYRHDWMAQMQRREVRIFDASILASLRQGTTFMASGAMLAVGGVLALAGNAEPLIAIVRGIGALPHPTLFWQAKLAVVAAFLVHALFKFIWSMRLFGYCAVMMSAVPNDPAHPDGPRRAEQAAEINQRAATNYNKGLRSIYFAFAALAWIAGAAALLGATAIVLWTVLSREFASGSRDVLSRD